MKSILVTLFVFKLIHCVTVTITEVVSVTTTIPPYNVDLILLSVEDDESQYISDQHLLEALSPYHLAPGYRGDLSPEENRKWHFYNETTESFRSGPTSTSDGLEETNRIEDTFTAIDLRLEPMPTLVNGGDDRDALYLGDSEELFLGGVPVKDDNYEIRELELEKGSLFIGIKRPFTDRKPNEHMPPPKNMLHTTEPELRGTETLNKSTSSVYDSNDRYLITLDESSSESHWGTIRSNDTLNITRTMVYLESTPRDGTSYDSTLSRTITSTHSDASSGITSTAPATTEMTWPMTPDSSGVSESVSNNNHPFKSIQVSQRTRATVGVRTNKRKPIKNPFRSSKNESSRITLSATLMLLFSLFFIFLFV